MLSHHGTRMLVLGHSPCHVTEALEGLRHLFQPMYAVANMGHPSRTIGGLQPAEPNLKLAASALERGDLPAFGTLMAEAHRSFRDDFEASCSELDTLVEIAAGLPGCYGARMTGGGFGGCTVNLVEENQADRFREQIHARYRATTGIDADIYLCRASAGARRL